MITTVIKSSLFTDSLVGHDVHDSTTVSDVFTPVDLPDNPSIQGLHIGIPKVGIYDCIWAISWLYC